MITTTAQHTGAPWSELVPPVYPEGNYIPVYCHKCGLKNREDVEWRYRDDPAQRAAEDAALRARGSSRENMRQTIAWMEPDRPWPIVAQLTYQCLYCRDDKEEWLAAHAADESEDDGGAAEGEEDRTRKDVEKRETAAAEGEGKREAKEAEEREKNEEEGVSSKKLRKDETGEAVAVAVKSESDSVLAKAENDAADNEEQQVGEEGNKKRTRPASPTPTSAGSEQLTSG